MLPSDHCEIHTLRINVDKFNVSFVIFLCIFWKTILQLISLHSISICIQLCFIGSIFKMIAEQLENKQKSKQKKLPKTDLLLHVINVIPGQDSRRMYTMAMSLSI